MWALVNSDNIVIECLIEMSLEEALLKEVDGNYIVEMTLDNSPAHVGGKFENKKFFKPQGSITEDNAIFSQS